jgi:hypothetical protein
LLTVQARPPALAARLIPIGRSAFAAPSDAKLACLDCDATVHAREGRTHRGGPQAPPGLLRQRLRPPEEAWLMVCFSGGAAERLHIGGGFNECGELEDYRMAHRFLCGRYPLVEVGLRIDTAMVAAERLIKTAWARSAVPKIATALHQRGVLSGDDVYALF